MERPYLRLLPAQTGGLGQSTILEEVPRHILTEKYVYQNHSDRVRDLFLFPRHLTSFNRPDLATIVFLHGMCCKVHVGF